MASCAGDSPSSAASALNLRTLPNRSSAGSPSTEVCNHSSEGWPSRESAAMPSLYLPVSRPEASGDQMVVPSPASAYSAAYSCSTRWRCSRLYCGCSMVGACRWLARAKATASAICAPDHSEVPQYNTLPWRTRVSMASTVSPIGVSGSGRWQ
ncbi:hypothetical protein D3C81_1147500 [compost metagenome]